MSSFGVIDATLIYAEAMSPSQYAYISFITSTAVLSLQESLRFRALVEYPLSYSTDASAPTPFGLFPLSQG
jgi:hypothetical protein